MNDMLPLQFFNRPTLLVARDLLGKYLVRSVEGKKVALMITETEAYDGFNDLASHARRGKTPRCAPMYGPSGGIYVYFTYGMHWMLNLVCGEKEYPAAVLIRGLESPEGKEIKLDGPGKLTRYLKIDKELSGKMLGRKSGLWVEDRGVQIPRKEVLRTGRIGVEYAGAWAKKPWRFVIKKDRRNRSSAFHP